MPNDYLAVIKDDRGVITWTGYRSKEDLDTHRANFSAHGQTVLDEGVTQARAIELTRTTPPEAYIATAVYECIDPKTQQLIPELVEHAAAKAAFAITGRIC